MSVEHARRSQRETPRAGGWAVAALSVLAGPARSDLARRRARGGSRLPRSVERVRQRQRGVAGRRRGNPSAAAMLLALAIGAIWACRVPSLQGRCAIDSALLRCRGAVMAAFGGERRDRARVGRCVLGRAAGRGHHCARSRSFRAADHRRPECGLLDSSFSRASQFQASGRCHGAGDEPLEHPSWCWRSGSGCWVRCRTAAFSTSSSRCRSSSPARSCCSASAMPFAR